MLSLTASLHKKFFDHVFFVIKQNFNSLFAHMSCTELVYIEITLVALLTSKLGFGAIKEKMLF